ncbi:MAG: RNA polymerase sigma factor [Bdellovibrionaceae bacterium]|nr:RNA polymerase sigma factor [Pseudobdellovibrionaceae bacterium]
MASDKKPDLKNSAETPRLTELVAAALKGEETAKSELIRFTQTPLFKFCVLLGNSRESAEDLCQDVYIKAFRNLDQLKNSEAFLGWLYQIAKNLFLDRKRTEKSTTHLIPDHKSPDSTPESILQLRQILSQFETEDRYLILLIELEGQSYKEAAELISCSEDAVRSRIHRLRHELLKKLK